VQAADLFYLILVREHAHAAPSGGRDPWSDQGDRRQRTRVTRPLCGHLR
jgi:hypothetical protein